MSSIIGRPEYIVYSYHFNLFSLYTLITIIYSIPPFLITIWMTRFLLENWNKSAMKNGLRPDVFYLFLVMQWASNSNVILLILITRLSLSGVYTSYCSADNPQWLINSAELLIYSVIFFKNSATVLFCAMRVFIMFSGRLERKIYLKELTFLLIVFAGVSLLLSWIRNFESSTCVQLELPYPFGAMELELDPPTNLSRAIESYTLSTILIILSISTAITFWKLYKLKLQSTSNSTSQRKKSNFKSEKTLAGTMALILMPILLSQVIITLQNYGYHSVALELIRSLSVDVRAHVVTCYFYWTHPIFGNGNGKAMGKANKDLEKKEKEKKKKKEVSSIG